jgi:hypothetical protein
MMETLEPFKTRDRGGVRRLSFPEQSIDKLKISNDFIGFHDYADYEFTVTMKKIIWIFGHELHINKSFNFI